jgi:hypothetical protein
MDSGTVMVTVPMVTIIIGIDIKKMLGVDGNG